MKMHRLLLVWSFLMLGAGLVAAAPTPAVPPGETCSSFDRPRAGEKEEMIPPGGLLFDQASVEDVLQAYQRISRRAVIRASVPATGPITFRNEHPVARREALQALDTVLAEAGVVMIPLGSRYMKAVSPKQAVSEPAPVVELPADQLPESNSYLTYIVELRHRRPSSVLPVLQPFARMPNSIVSSDENNLLILRDYSVNVRRMLQVLDRLEQTEPGDVEPIPNLPRRRPAGAAVPAPTRIPGPPGAP